MATGYTGTVHFTSSDGRAGCRPTTPSRPATLGHHDFSASTLKTPGTQTITATDTVTGSITGTTRAITVTVGGDAHFIVSGYTAPTTPRASPYQRHGHRRDAFGNVTAGYTGTVHFTSDRRPGASLPANYTFVAGDNGVHTFTATLKTAGSQTITATDTVTGSITGTPTRSRSGPAGGDARSTVDRRLAEPPASAFRPSRSRPWTRSATSPPATPARSTSPAATPRPSLPADYTFVAGDNGAHTFTAHALKTAGSQTITATDTVTGSITGTQRRSRSTPPAATPRCAVRRLRRRPRRGPPSQLTVTARDAFGNTATGYTGTVHFTSTDAPGRSLPANYTFIGGDNGAHTFARRR